MASEKQERLRMARERLNHKPEWHDFHATQTIVFQQMLNEGFDWGRNDYGQMYTEYTEDMRRRINGLIETTYALRELGDIPYRFKVFMKKNLNLALGQWIIPLKMLWEQKQNLLNDGYMNSRDRTVNSDYPANQIDPQTSDYANNSSDHVYGEDRTAPPLDAILRIMSEYEALENKIVKSVENCFLSILPAYYKDLKGDCYE